MIEDLKPYPKYKGSGLAWLGEIPAHWSEKRVKFFFREADERSANGNEMLMSVSHKTGVTPRKQHVTMFLAESAVGYKICLPGDIAINTMWAFMGALGITRQEGIVSPSYGVYRALRTGILNSKYLDNLLRTDIYKSEYIRRSKGINSSRLRLYPDQFLQIPLICPPPEEQDAIARFLAWATIRLDRAIRAKRRIIALLNEQKQAIIHRAVTRGLDPSVPLKDSGVPWLGDIPEHWGVDRLKGITTPIEQGWSPQCDAQPSGEDEWGVLKVGCVNRDAFDEQQNKKLPAGMKPPTALEIRDGDILVSRANTRDLLGLAAVAIRPRPRLLLCDKLFRFRANPAAVDAKFLVYTLRQRTSRAQIESSTNGASDSMQNIGQGVIRNLMLSVPPLQEQLQILEALQIQTAGLMSSISRAEQEILLLQEYRTRLIADVVTGKLDVREVAAGLPQEAELLDIAAQNEDIGELEEGEDEEPELT